MEVPNDAIKRIFDAIECNCCRDLLKGPDNNRFAISGYLLRLEDDGYISIIGKTVYEGKYVDFINLEMTNNGRELHKWMKDDRKKLLF